jgi:hypothetical protein
LFLFDSLERLERDRLARLRRKLHPRRFLYRLNGNKSHSLFGHIDILSSEKLEALRADFPPCACHAQDRDPTSEPATALLRNGWCHSYSIASRPTPSARLARTPTSSRDPSRLMIDMSRSIESVNNEASQVSVADAREIGGRDAGVAVRGAHNQCRFKFPTKGFVTNT